MPKTLLLADDSVTIQKVVGISFANEDIVLLTVDNGDDAVARAREARPDLVLADVMMPGKDGYEVCEAIKSDPELRHVPVLLLSGTFEPYDEERARRAGADGHITKPFEAQALVDQVSALLERSAAAHETAAASDATMLVNPPLADDPDAAFDFFDEEMAQTAPSPAGTAPQLGDPDDALELEAAVEDDGETVGADSAFAETSGGSDPRATIAILEDEVAAPAAAGAVPFFGEDFDEVALSEPASATPAAPTNDAPLGYEESFDFGFDEGRTTAPPPPAPAEREPVGGVAATELFEGGLEALDDDIDAGLGAAPPAVADAPLLPAPPPVPATALAGSAPPAPPRELSDALRKELQQNLEKVAWEAFGDLSERIVRETLERVEAVAWEVIPQMAEALIREEIRRLKGSDE
jgi:CheY-like chemotaxis protein